MARARVQEKSYLQAYADLLWEQHAAKIRAAGSMGLGDWLEPIVRAFAMTASEASVLCGYLNDKLRDEAVVRTAPPSDDPLFR